MQQLKKLLILFILPLFLTVSCMDATENTNSVTEEKSECPVPGKTGVLKSISTASAEENYSFTYNELIYIQSPGTGEPATLTANVMIPVKKNEEETFPAIIFPNSWAMDEHEYIMQAQKFAKKGYIVLGYSCRGWYLSTGKVSLGGRDEVADFQAVLDWLIANTPVDKENIGACGISYGAIQSLNALCHDNRLKTVAVLSIPSDVARHLYSEQTPRLVWGGFLVATGTVLARMDPILYKVYESTLTNTNINWLMDWVYERSPINYIDNINSKNNPVYMSHNFEDYLFTADSVISLFNKLSVDHKRLDLNLGTHATGELTGLMGLDNYAFNNVHKWFDYWLRGVDTGIIPEQSKSAVVTMQEKNNGNRVTYDTASLEKSDGSYTWPASTIHEKSFYLAPRGLFTNGSMNTSFNTKITSNNYWSGLLSGATAGAAIIPIFEQFGVELCTNVYLLNRAESIAWESTSFSSKMKIRGASEAKLNISFSGSKGQIIAYLYDVDKWGKAVFITHGAYTFWDVVPGKSFEVTVPILATAYDVPAGHHLALVIDSSDVMYGKPTLMPYTTKVYYNSSSAKQNVVVIPFEN
jgi:putative CocE/NonD family hydrolase